MQWLCMKQIFILFFNIFIHSFIMSSDKSSFGVVLCDGRLKEQTVFV